MAMSPEWKSFIDSELKKEYMITLREKISERRKLASVFPEGHLTFNAFTQCSYHDLKIVLLGIEPSPFPGVNNGLAFSCNSKASSALKSIQNEIFQDYFNGNVGGVNVFQTNDLTQWANQGVLLLNILLTCEDGKTKAHKEIGWETFTENAIKMINLHQHKLVFMLFGKEAKEYKKLINDQKHLIIESEYPTHPKFKKCKAFTKANAWIKKHYWNIKPTINWALLNDTSNITRR